MKMYCSFMWCEAPADATPSEEVGSSDRQLSWPKQVMMAGGPAAWNQRLELAPLLAMLGGMADVGTADDALTKVRSMIQLDHL